MFEIIAATIVGIIIYLLVKLFIIHLYSDTRRLPMFSLPIINRDYVIYRVESKESLLTHILLFLPLFEISWLIFAIIWSIFSILEWIIVKSVPWLIKLVERWIDLPDTEEDKKNKRE